VDAVIEGAELSPVATGANLGRLGFRFRNERVALV
jgi:hypothetical protein